MNESLYKIFLRGLTDYIREERLRESTLNPRHAFSNPSKYSRVGQIAKSLVNFSATSFSHPFYQSISGHAKKVGKSWCLRVNKWIQSLCSKFTKEIRPNEQNIKFEPFIVLPRAQMPSQWTGHKKLHDIGYQDHQNRTIFMDFRRF